MHSIWSLRDTGCRNASPMVQTPVPLGHLDGKGGLEGLNPRTDLLRDLRKGSDFVFGGRKKKGA